MALLSRADEEEREGGGGKTNAFAPHANASAIVVHLHYSNLVRKAICSRCSVLSRETPAARRALREREKNNRVIVASDELTDSGI